MSQRRAARLNELLKREISGLLSRRVRDHRVGQVLVTEVRVTPDLWLARVFVRPLVGETSAEECLEGLEAAAPFLRRELGKILRLRRVPELRFLHDTTLDAALRIEAVLRELAQDREGGKGGEGGSEV